MSTGISRYKLSLSLTGLTLSGTRSQLSHRKVAARLETSVTLLVVIQVTIANRLLTLRCPITLPTQSVPLRVRQLAGSRSLRSRGFCTALPVSWLSHLAPELPRESFEWDSRQRPLRIAMR